jgi:hypothetical protein
MSEYCVARTRGDAPWYRGGPCSRKAVRDGYCNIHHPEKTEARRKKAADEAQARYAAKVAQSPWTLVTRYRDALRKIADGDNDARSVALKALGDSDTRPKDGDAKQGSTRE